jgi:ABC-type maltose transport system permease subunit
MVSAPLFILFVLFRKYIMHGVSRSGTKGWFNKIIFI